MEMANLRHILGGKIMEQKEKELQPQTRAYTVEEIAAILHIGQSSAYTKSQSFISSMSFLSSSG